MKHQRPYQVLGWCALALSLMLAGCGGGLRGLPANDLSSGFNNGGDNTGCLSTADSNTASCLTSDTANTQDNSSNTSDTINESNATAVMNAALTAIEETYGLGQAEGLVISGVATDAPPSLGAFLKEFLIAVNEPVASQGLTLPMVLGVVTSPLNIHCAEGDLLRDSQSSTHIVFNVPTTCTLPSGVSFTGTITISEFNVTGNVSANSDWSMSALFSFADFSITFGSTTLGVTGDMRYKAQKVDVIEEGTVKVEKTVGFSNNGQTTSLNTDFGVNYTYDYSGTDTLTLDPFGTFTSSNFTGLNGIEVSSGSSPDPLIQQQATDGANYSGGKLVITTSGGTSTAALDITDLNTLAINAGGTILTLSGWAELRNAFF